jgi:hypothetical protein
MGVFAGHGSAMDGTAAVMLSDEQLWGSPQQADANYNVCGPMHQVCPAWDRIEGCLSKVCIYAASGCDGS